MKRINFNWENVFLSLLVIVVVGLISFAGATLTAKEKVFQYSLSESGGGWKIEKHIDWRANDYIQLDRAITLDEAVEAVNKLNETLKK